MILQTQTASADILSTKSCQAFSCHPGSLINDQLHLRWVCAASCNIISNAEEQQYQIENMTQWCVNVWWLVGKCRLWGRNPLTMRLLFGIYPSRQSHSCMWLQCRLNIFSREKGEVLCVLPPFPTVSQNVSKSKLKSKQSLTLSTVHETTEMQWPSDAVIPLQKEQSMWRRGSVIFITSRKQTHNEIILLKFVGKLRIIIGNPLIKMSAVSTVWGQSDLPKAVFPDCGARTLSCHTDLSVLASAFRRHFWE